MRALRFRASLYVGVSVGAAWLLGLGPAAAEALKPGLRRPVALTLSPDGQQLYVANSRGESLSVIDLSRKTETREVALGGRPSDLKPIGRGQALVATVESTHELVLLKGVGAELTVAQRLPVATWPVSVVVARDGRHCVVASLWSRRLTFVDLSESDAGKVEVSGMLDLPFAPRCQLLVKDDTVLLVADSHGARLAVVDMVTQSLKHVREFPGHNIRGMATTADGSMLVVAHQMLNELAHSIRNDVHWGLMMSNDLRWLRLDSVLAADADLYEGAHMHPLGQAGNATGDPAGLVMSPSGQVIVSLGGVGEIAVGRERDFGLSRLEVGRRPTALTTDAEGQRVFVTNTFDDSISVVDLVGRQVLDTISLGPTAELSVVDQGELLFFDAGLSHDSWMSCHSCHSDGHTNGLASDNFGDASFGAPKLVLSLLGRAGTEPFAWNASAATLPEQIRKSIINTMQSDETPTDQQVAALAAYVESLPPPPPLDRARNVEDNEALARGSKLFGALACYKCHQPPHYTTPRTYDVGLVDKLGKRHFNPPSLIGVGQRGPYFHDARAPTLEAVFVEHGHQLEQDLSTAELADLLAFLRSL